MNYLDKVDEIAQGFKIAYKNFLKDANSTDQIEIDFNFLNEDRLIKLKNNLGIYKEEISQLFLNEAFINIKKDNVIVDKILFSYSQENNGLTIICENMFSDSVHGGGFSIKEDGEIDVFGAMTKKEFELYSKLTGYLEFEDGMSEEQYVKSVINNLIIDYAAIILYIDFLSKYKKEFVTVTTKAIETKRNPKKKSKGRPKRKVNLIKKITINSDAIRQYEKAHSEVVYTRHVDSWTVSGHFRTYKKTGKKVWVAPYVKGDPSKKKGKTYIIK